MGRRKVKPGMGRDMPGDSCNRNLGDKLAMSGWLPSGFETGGVAAPCRPFMGQAAAQGECSPGAWAEACRWLKVWQEPLLRLGQSGLVR
jgi:hypothetical protein